MIASLIQLHHSRALVAPLPLLGVGSGHELTHCLVIRTVTGVRRILAAIASSLGALRAGSNGAVVGIL